MKMPSKQEGTLFVIIEKYVRLQSKEGISIHSVLTPSFLIRGLFLKFPALT